MAFLASEHEKLSAHERACLLMGPSDVLWRTWLQSFSCQKPTYDVLAPHPPWEQFAANMNGAVSGQSPIQPPDSMVITEPDNHLGSKGGFEVGNQLVYYNSTTTRLPELKCNSRQGSLAGNFGKAQFRNLKNRSDVGKWKGRVSNPFSSNYASTRVLRVQLTMATLVLRRAIHNQ
ncbi:hypothetical protein I7I51_01240 [Histoplasma capsulatum]|uniref:Uncharacterized protein n=1 Tax=Ajellomyces capsulatus TaxID=5037 RepID=A0A8A1ME60_AJECA|nr:hypothetical protein I7I51_01240 [Histoplasma capsulatum]